ncbi:hypothetical protein OWR29_03650 [Actinoplanes sp. Pm04-4]|uniref:Uncharacterized protein n=1 Tax=Paractinoplanes pyxinae TaxID=2997416 RepID=A0ABT4AS53_9ACTN|nr:hypothetical protein [Actinoplanes pyxinae]MCY1137079.1 hypothetical protein [Actinoplanes pyxinae]
MTSFELAWPHDHYGPGTTEWLTIAREPDGQWWYDGFMVGRVPISGGAEHVAAFARWLPADPPAGTRRTSRC